MAAMVAMTATQNGAILVAIMAIAIPIAAFAFARSGEAWRSIGKGPFAIEPEAPTRSRREGAEPVDPAIQAAEVRQMLEAKAERRRRRGEAPLDVEAETTRLLADADADTAGAGDPVEAELREEVRQLVVARNERRLRQGLEPLDVEKEIERQLADFVGSS